MHRSCAVLPALGLVLLVSTLSGPADERVTARDEALALAAAVREATWNCSLPRRGDQQQTARGQVRDAQTPPARTVAEAEPAGAGGRNDRPDTAQPVLDGPGGGDAGVRVTGQLSAEDVDSYQVPMLAGDVVGVALRGAGQLVEIRDPSGQLVEGSDLNRSSIYPLDSPLPTVGDVVADHVAAVSGTHIVSVLRGSGSYRVDIERFQPPSTRQRLFLDFDGAAVDTTRFGVAPDASVSQPATLTGLREFLPRWGLRPSDEAALIRVITDTVRENLQAEPATGPGGPIQLEITTSAEGPDRFGQTGVSRVIVGGTIDEVGVNTVGIAESIDPGNFVREETALVLLDTLSAPPGQPASLNEYLTEASDRVAFVGRAIGNIVAHEAGHFLGSWHTDATNERSDLMDPGEVRGAFGFGPDGVGGTADDTDTRFGRDPFAPEEGFTGTEDTRNRTAVGLSPRGAGPT